MEEADVGPRYIKKTMRVSYVSTTREMVDLINKLEVPREDIVQVLPSVEGYMIIYYY